MNMRIFSFFVLGLFWGVQTFAQAPTGKLIRFSADQAAFAYDANASLFEIYLSFEAKSLPFVAASSGGFVASVPIQWSLRRNTAAVSGGNASDPLRGEAMRLSFAAADTSAFKRGEAFLHLFRDAVPAGDYELTVQVLADPSQNIAASELTKQVSIRPFHEATKPRFSDLIFASQIKNTLNRESLFYRSGVEVQPNPSLLFGNGLNRLYFYVEAYHLSAIKTNPNSSEYTFLAYVSEASAPQPIQNMQVRNTRPLQDTDALMGSFEVSSLRSGSYFLRVAVLNENNEAVFEQNRKFFVYNPAVVVQQAVVDPEEEFLASPFMNYNENEAKEELEHVGAIVGITEERQIRNLKTLEAKRRWLYDFWKGRDPNPNTRVNEYRVEFYEMLRLANERYSNKYMQGWKTDRGRTVLKYGLPSATEPHLYDREAVPHERWEYNNIPGEGRAEFIFADMGGFGEMELIHTTISGGRKSGNWQAEVRTGKRQ